MCAFVRPYGHGRRSPIVVAVIAVVGDKDARGGVPYLLSVYALQVNSQAIDRRWENTREKVTNRHARTQTQLED